MESVYRGLSYLILACLASLLFQFPTVVAQPYAYRYALLVTGFAELDNPNFLFDTYYMNYMLLDAGWHPDHIRWLCADTDIPVYPGEFYALATKQNVRDSISWLKQKTGNNDLVLIYFSSHGGGFDLKENKLSRGGRIDDDGDEGNEHFKDGEWFGVDESIMLYPNAECFEYYWDDEVKQDLSGLNPKNLVFILQDPPTEEEVQNGNQSCFGGGFIDDLSATNRIIVSASNETGSSYGDLDGDGVSEFSESFIDALFGWDVTVVGTVNGILFNSKVNADFDNSGYVSTTEAFEYALQHDDAHLQGKEYPWIDNDGDGLPTYRDGKEILDTEQGSFNSDILWLSGDTNMDGKVDMTDLYNVLMGYLLKIEDAVAKYGIPETTDMDGDGYVDLDDLYSVIMNY